MHNQALRLFLYSSFAIVALTLVWGFRYIPKQGTLAEEHLRAGLEQELLLLSSAVKSSTAAMKFRLLDVLKAEGNDHPTRAFQDSPFLAASLIEWNDSQWKTLWFSSKKKDQVDASALREWMKEWPLARIADDEAFFVKAADFDGQAHFALIMPVRRPNNTPMLGIGVFPAAQFGLVFAAEQKRVARVFDSQGNALALQHPAYLGASLRREPLVAEILEGDTVSVRQEWKDEKGMPLTGVAARLGGSNLGVAIETPLALGRSWILQAWLYLILCAAGALVLNWLLFGALVNPLLAQLEQTEQALEKMRRQLAEAPVELQPAPPAPAAEKPIPSAELPLVGFLESATVEAVPAAPAPVPKTSLARLVTAALREFEGRIRESGVTVNRIGLKDVEIEGEAPQLQTAVGEVVKNALEAMADAPERQLTLTAARVGQRLRLSIEDTGCGIAPENVKKVFDPFFSTKDSQGVARGLGLNVVRRVVEELEGTVEVRNRLGGSGAVVDIEWPAEKSARPEADTHAAVRAPISAEGPARSLEFLGDDDIGPADEFSAVTIAHREWPNVQVRKPKVRTTI